MALIPFLATSPPPSAEHKLIYFVALCAIALIALLSTLAAASTHRERAESISAIKADFDKHILKTFEVLDE